DARRRVFGALDARARSRDENGASRLTDGERGAGVDADERLLEHDGIRRVALHQRGDSLVDGPQPELRALPRGGSPPAEVDRPESACAFVDDAVTARSSAWIDAEDRHAERLGAVPDVPPPAVPCLLSPAEVRRTLIGTHAAPLFACPDRGGRRRVRELGRRPPSGRAD